MVVGLSAVNGNDLSQNDLAGREFASALERLIFRSTKSSRKDDSQIQADVQIICDFAHQNGLPPLALQQLLNLLIKPAPFDQSTLLQLIASLYPVSPVSSNTVCTVVNALGYGKRKPSVALQNALLKWLIMIKDVLEDKAILSSLYGVLFNMLEMLSIRANLCRLLATITRRQHVKPFRCQFLKDISTEHDCDIALNHLVQVFSDYCLDGSFSGVRQDGTDMITSPDQSWRDRLKIIQDFHKLNSQGKDISFRTIRKWSDRMSPSNELTTFKRLAPERAKTAVPLSAIDSMQDFVNNLENIEISNLIHSGINDHTLQKYGLLISRRHYTQRLNKSLESFFEEQPGESDDKVSAQRLTDKLGQILEITRYVKILPTAAEYFLKIYLLDWNGNDNRETVLALLSYIEPRPFAELQASHFTCLETALIDNTAPASIALLEFYTTLLQHWITHLLACAIDVDDKSSDGLVSVIKSDSSRISDTNVLALISTITSLTSHTSLLILTLLTTHQSTSHVLSYLETLSILVSQAASYPTLNIPVLDPLTIYLLTFLEPSISSLSRLCSVLATHKLAIEAKLARPPISSPSSEQPHAETPYKHSITHFNGFLMDICNLLWRSRAFNTSEPNACGCLLPPAILPYLATYTSSLQPPHLLQTCFSLSFHSVLASLSDAALRELEEQDIAARGESEVRVQHAGPVTQRSLLALGREGGLAIGWKEYRLAVLAWLEKRGMKGLEEFMGCTMKGLMDKGEGSSAV